MRLSPLLLLSICLVFNTGCIKNALNALAPPPGGSDDTGEVTATGIPNGTPVTKTIGAGGGSMVSSDGKFTLTVPAAALSSDLSITIQPITNQAPGGIDGGYELLPSGTKFATPVTLSYHYTSIDSYGTSPYFLYIATQDSTGAWKNDVVNRDLDSVNNIISITTAHFSSYVPVSSLHLEFGQTSFSKGESNYMKVMETLVKQQYSGPVDDINLPFLPIHKNQQVPDDQVSHWSLNDMGPATADVGIIAGTGGNVNYAAPGSIDKTQKVKVSVEVTGPFVTYIKGRKITLNKVILVGRITLLSDKMSFNVVVDYSQTGTSPCFLDNYTDGATFQVDVDGDKVSVTNIVNRAPHVDPLSGTSTDGSGDICTYEPDGFGNVNITGGSGTVSAAGIIPPGGTTKYALINIDSKNTIDTKWKITDTGGNTSELGGYAIPGFPQTVGIVLKDSVQVIKTSVVTSTGHAADGTITISMIH